MLFSTSLFYATKGRIKIRSESRMQAELLPILRWEEVVIAVLEEYSYE